jgi:aminopeptidase N
VAWAASPEYQWDASGWDGILAQAFYRPTATLWKEAARMTRASIREYSTRWFRYPYPQITSVEGPVTGMEYPMLDMDGTDDSRQGLFSTATHEIGHNWFPMIVGSNERRYAWMDEGFNTFINTFSEEDYFQRSDSARRIGEQAFVLRNDQSPTAQPIITPANRYINNANLGSLAYIKPSIGLLVLRNKVLGPELFDAAFQAYIRRWAFRHPTPADFFRTMEDVSGRDLSWFWRGWFLTTAALDQAVEDVSQQYRNGYNVVRVTVGNRGQQVMPVEMRLSLADGTSQMVRLPVEIWYEGNRYTATVRTSSPVTGVMIAPDRMFPDVDFSNNGWTGGK